MLRKPLLVGLAILAAACVPITPEPTAAVEPAQTPGPTGTPERSQRFSMIPANEDFTECPDDATTDVTLIQVIGGYLGILPGQSAVDPVADNIPDYIDIIGVETELDGTTLTAIFFLRDIPEELEINREGAAKTMPEYMWQIYIDVDGGYEPEFEQLEYLFGAYSSGNIGLTNVNTTTALFEEVVEISLFRLQPPDRLIHVSASNPRLLVSYEDNTLTLISEVPGITPESSLMFTTIDSLFGNDSVSCQPS